MRRSTRSQSVVRSQAFRKIMVAVESQEKAKRSVDLALRLSSMNAAELLIFHVRPLVVPVIPSPGFGVPHEMFAFQTEGPLEGLRKNEEEWLSKIAASAEESGVRTKAEIALPVVPVAEEVVRKAEDEGVDLIITGTSDASGLRRLLEGSVSAEVMKKARCPVLVAR
jgi:nucleotide-binding universal stress UspA family protein